MSTNEIWKNFKKEGDTWLAYIARSLFKVQLPRGLTLVCGITCEQSTLLKIQTLKVLNRSHPPGQMTKKSIPDRNVHGKEDSS